MPKKVEHTTPEPVVVQTICSMCGLAWERHGEDPTPEDCIRLLKAELATRPVIVSYPINPVYPVYPQWQYRVGDSAWPSSSRPITTCQIETKASGL